MKIALKLDSENYILEAVYLAEADYEHFLTDRPDLTLYDVLSMEDPYIGATKLVETEGIYILENDEVKLQALLEKENSKASYEDKINEDKEYLSETDYVVLKISEAKLSSESAVEELQAKYSEIISKREAARTEINELEEKLAAL